MFKPDIDDLRESPALEITHMIADWHAGTTLAVEPNVHELPEVLADKVTLTDTAKALEEADILVMLVDHSQFKVIGADQVKQEWIIDTKGVWR